MANAFTIKDWISGTVGALGIIGILFGLGKTWGHLTGDLEIYKRDIELNKKRIEAIEKAEAKANISIPDFPLGTVIPIHMNKTGKTSIYRQLPYGWILCDGSTLNEKHPSELTKDEVSLFWGEKVLDLRDSFLKGWDDGRWKMEGGSNVDMHVHTASAENPIPKIEGKLDDGNTHHRTDWQHKHEITVDPRSHEEYSNAPKFNSVVFIIRVVKPVYSKEKISNSN